MIGGVGGELSDGRPYPYLHPRLRTTSSVSWPDKLVMDIGRSARVQRADKTDNFEDSPRDIRDSCPDRNPLPCTGARNLRRRT